MPVTPEPLRFGQQADLDDAENTALSGDLPFAAYHPNLTVSALPLSAIAQAARHTVPNAGRSRPAFRIPARLSTDDTLNTGDVVLGSPPLASLAAGAASSAVSVFTVLVTMTMPATYPVIVVANAIERQAGAGRGRQPGGERRLPRAGRRRRAQRIRRRSTRRPAPTSRRRSP